MAHFAQINANNVVLRVVVLNNDVLLDENGIEQEELGVKFCEEMYGGKWLQTSYNGSKRMNFASIDSVYVPEKDAFSRGKKPFPSWVLNTETMEWEAPITKPTNPCYWNEDNMEWIEYIPSTPPPPSPSPS
jgi:hypothetical protein